MTYLFLLYCLYYKYVCHIKHFTVVLKSVDMSGSENIYGHLCYRPLNISYQALNVGLWPKIEGFCHLMQN